MSDVILTVEDLTVSFDGFKAVDGLNFYVEKDELRCVIGPNGAGKTTLLDMICGKTRPSAGSIRFDNRELTGMMEYQITRFGVGRKFQTPSTYEDLTVFENLEISYPKPRNISGCLFFRQTSAVRSRIEQMAEMAIELVVGLLADIGARLAPQRSTLIGRQVLAVACDGDRQRDVVGPFANDRLEPDRIEILIGI